MLREKEFAKSIFADRGSLNSGHKLLYCTSTEETECNISIFSRRRNWDSPTPSPTGECAPPLFGSGGSGGGGAHSLGVEGVGVPIPTRGHTYIYV
jgi:hypothetical protein